MRRRQLFLLFAVLVACSSGDGSAVVHVPEHGQVDIKRALELGFRALGDRPDRWRDGCNIRIRPGKDDWSIYFEPVPMGPGLDVMVIVHPDGTTTIGPGY